ncbi:hypothetical protein ACRN98_21985 [Shewanella oncorhynchi]|uniref:hypothetical protein n=4 Tax=Shewanellaceae TaxID=267890 RepID=UPI0021DB7135|nr:hypothetical protein [Shewanella sp. SM69]MCU8036933.1 hypothetical protein [Shewanella sp. SM69]
MAKVNGINQMGAAAANANDEENLTPEEEKQLTDAMKVVKVIIHGEGQTGDQIAAMIKDSEDIAKGIGSAVAAVLIAVSKQMEFSDDIKLVLATEILIELSDIAVDAGALAEDEITEQFVDTAVSQAYSAYISTKEAMGELDVNELKQSVDDANKEGQALGVVPKQAEPKGLMQRAAVGGV